MYYRLAILTPEHRWEWADNTLLFEHQVNKAYEVILACGIPESHIFCVVGETVEELHGKLANINAADIGPLDQETEPRKEWVDPPVASPSPPLRGQRLAPEQKIKKKTAQEEKMDARRLELENSTAPVKNTRYYYQSPHDWKEYRKWIQLSRRVQAGEFQWEHNPADSHNT